MEFHSIKFFNLFRRKLFFFSSFSLVALIVFSSCTLDLIPNKAGSVHIIGVALDYEHMYANLKGTIDDVIETATMFKYIYEDKGLKVDEKYFLQTGKDPDINGSEYPSIDNLLNYISALETGKNDLILFIFSGHGVLGLSPSPALLMGVVDSSTPYPVLEMPTLFEALEEKGCQTLAIIDACYSGGMAISWEQSINEGFENMFKKQSINGVTVFAAARSFEESHFSEGFYDSDEAHGIFTYYLLKELGWSHTDNVNRTVSSNGTEYSVHGYPYINLPSGLEARVLFDSVIKNKERSDFMALRGLKEIPVMNSGKSELVVIP